MSDPLDVEIMHIRGEGDHARRLRDMRDLAHRHPRDQRVWLAMSQVAHEAGAAEDSLTAFEHALSARAELSEHAPPWIPQVLGERLEALRHVAILARGPDRQRELDALRRASARFPDFTPILFNHAVAAARLGLAAEARELARRAVAQSPAIARVLPDDVRRLIASADLSAPPSDPYLDRVIGGYRTIRIATRAPEHVLYDAVAVADHTPVTLRRYLDMTPDRARSLFADQMRAGTGGGAPALLVHAIGVADAEDGTAFQVLERVQGVTAWEAFQGGATDLDTAVHITWLTAREIHLAFQEHRFIHGQLGPSNVVVALDNFERPIRLLDSGLSARLEARRGTLPLQLAPEMDPSHQSDVYGLGVLLHYLITGAVPPPGQPLAHDRLASRDISERLRAVIAKSLAPIDRRYPYAVNVATGLDPVFATPAVDVKEGDTVGEWLLVREISDDGGTYGRVYAARHVHHADWTAAVKVLRPELCSREIRWRFAREAEHTPEHPGIVRVLRGGPPTPGVTCFAMELLQGETLRKRLDRGRLTVAQVVTFAMEIAQALAFAHGSDLVHRDLKPENLFVLDPPGNRHIKLLDFGVAKKVSPGMKSIRPQPIGTEAYMAPEQFVNPAAVNDRSDVYALGVVLVECITGQLAAGTSDWRSFHVTVPIVAPGLVAAHHPGLSCARELEDVLRRMTAKAAAERPAMSEVMNAFRAISHTVPGTAYHGTARARIEPAPAPAAVPRPANQFGLLAIAADVSRSMFTFGPDGGVREAGKAWDVARSLATTLTALALPGASTSRSLLVGLLAFGDQAGWADLAHEPLQFLTTPRLMRPVDLVAHGLAAAQRLGHDPSDPPAALARYLFAVFDAAARTCGDGGTSYQAAIDAIGDLLRWVGDTHMRTTLYPGWDRIAEDRLGRYLRCFLYSDGRPNMGMTDANELVARCRAACGTPPALLMTASFADDSGTEPLLRRMASECPIHHGTPCAFPGAHADRFRAIIRMATGGSGACPSCLR